jgi:hypothetical protein
MHFVILFFMVYFQSSFASPEQENDPSEKVLGFELGKDSHEIILNKLNVFSSKCVDKPGLTRKVHIYDCKGELPIDKLEPRKVRGKWTGLYLSREESSPLHYVSLSRQYSIPSAVIEDYESSATLLKKTLGEPKRQDKLKEDDFDGPILRVLTLWEKTNLKVELSVIKMGSSTISVYEKWTNTALNKKVTERPGQKGHMGGSAKKFEGDVGEIERKSDAIAITDVFAQRAELSKKEIVVTGKVVKKNKVFGTNWYHIQDGSGDEASKNNDLTITSPESVELGQILSFKGTLTIDKDFGFGYFYTAIIEDAVVIKDAQTPQKNDNITPVEDEVSCGCGTYKKNPFSSIFLVVLLGCSILRRRYV